MHHLIFKYYHIHSGEGKRISLMFAYIFLVIAVILMVKSVSTSLFLSNLGVEKLPSAFIMVAIASIVITSIYNRLEQSISLLGSTKLLLVLSIISLLIFRILLSSSSENVFLYYLLYIWVALFGVTITAQFWLLANTIFNAREAKRLFGVLGTGAIVGGIGGGYFTNLLAPLISSENLLLCAAGTLVPCIFIAHVVIHTGVQTNFKVTPSNRQKLPQTRKAASPFQTIKTSKLLTYTMLLITLSVLCASFIDFQFNALASDTISDPNKLAAFIGFWLSTLSLISLIVQLLFTQRIITAIGVCPSLILLPVGILFGAVSVIISPSLISAVLLKVTGGSLRNSIYKSSIELLSVPVPPADKKRTKTFIDVISDNVATGLSGILLLLLTQYLGFTVQNISLIVILLVAVQIIFSLRIRKHYINMFRKAIERRSISLDNGATAVHDPLIRKSLLANLNTYNERQLIYVLQLIPSIDSNDAFNKIRDLTNHPNATIRFKAISLLSTFESADATKSVYPLLHDTNRDVQIQALKYISQKNGQRNKTLITYLHNNDESVIYAVLLCAARALATHPDEQLMNVFINSIEYHLNCSPSVEALEITAQAISDSGISCLYPYLIRLLNHSDTSVQKAAILAGGTSRYQPAIIQIIQVLKNPKMRNAARKSLVRSGLSQLHYFSGLISDETVHIIIRKELIRVIGEIGEQQSADTLLRFLNDTTIPFTSDIIHALLSLRQNAPFLHFSVEKLTPFILHSINYYWIMDSAFKALFTIHSSDNRSKTTLVQNARHLMMSALQEKISKNIEHSFTILGLHYNYQDMADAFIGLKSSNSRTSAHSIEFLDSVLHRTIKNAFLPVAENFALKTSGQVHVHRKTDPDADDFTIIEPLLNGTDSWLRVCAVYLLGTLRNPEYLAHLKRFEYHPDFVIRDTACHALHSLESSPQQKYSPC